MPSHLSRLLAFSVAGVTALTAFSPDAHADRRSSFAGNMLIHDQDDMYLWPQLTLEHRNLVSFDYFPGAALSSVLGSGAPGASGGSGPVSSNNSFNNGFNNSFSNNEPVSTNSVTPNGLGPRSEDAANALGNARV